MPHMMTAGSMRGHTERPLPASTRPAPPAMGLVGAPEAALNALPVEPCREARGVAANERQSLGCVMTDGGARCIPRSLCVRHHGACHMIAITITITSGIAITTTTPARHHSFHSSQPACLSPGLTHQGATG